MLGLSHPSEMWFGIHPDWVYGEKEKIKYNFSLLGFLLSKSTWMCNKKTPIPFPSAYTGTKYLVASRWSTGRLGCERFSISTLSLCGPKSGIKCYLFLFALLPLSLSVTFLVRRLEVTARKQRCQGLRLNHQFGVLPLVHSHWPQERSPKSISFPLPSSWYDFP